MNIPSIQFKYNCNIHVDIPDVHAKPVVDISPRIEMKRPERKSTDYRDFGLVNSDEIFKQAIKEKFAVPAYNFNNMEQLQAILEGCSESKSPVIIQVSKGARDYANIDVLMNMAKGAIDMIRKKGSNIPVVLHLDHGDSFETCKQCIDAGFSSVMIDGSHLPYEENVTLTKRVVEYAHGRSPKVTVEGELGILAGVEDDVKSEHTSYTDPEKVIDFAKRTGVDSLAIAIGTAHGAYKFKASQCTRNEEGVLTPPPLRIDILKKVQEKLPGMPIVLHGASSVLPQYVDLINKYGGKMKDAIGVPADQLREAARHGVTKINIDSDGRLVVTAKLREFMAKNPDKFDPRDYLKVARAELKEMVKRKNKDVLGSADRIVPEPKTEKVVSNPVTITRIAASAA